MESISVHRCMLALKYSIFSSVTNFKAFAENSAEAAGNQTPTANLSFPSQRDFILVSVNER